MAETNGWGFLYQSNMDEASLQKAMDEMGENPDDRLGALETFKEWIDQQKSWLRTPTDPNFLMSFLRMRKFSQLLARKALINYWLARYENPRWFGDVDSGGPLVQKIIGEGALVILPGRDKEGRTILLGRPGLIDPSGKGYTSDEMFKAAFAVADHLLRDENTQVNGFVSITDFTGLSVMHNSFQGSGNMRKNTAIWMKVYPIRSKAIHHYNIGPVGEIAFMLAKPFLPVKLQGRIFNHSTLVSLYDHIDKSMLPDEYLPDDHNGPSAGSIQGILDKMQAELAMPSTRDYIKRLSNGEYGVIRKKMPAEHEYMQSYRKMSEN